MAHKKGNPVVAELDDIASELEKTGNYDLAAYVDEIAADVSSSKPSRKKKTRRSKKNRSSGRKRPARKTAAARRSRIASAMRRIASSQVTELEDIASELIKEGDKTAALEVLKIAEDLDSEYCTKHKAPESKGDASKRYDRSKSSKPDAKMDKEEQDELDALYDEEFYPLDIKKESAFNTKLDELIRLAMDEGDDMTAADRMYAADEEDEDDLGLDDFDGDEDDDESGHEEPDGDEGDDEDMDMDMDDEDMDIEDEPADDDEGGAAYAESDDDEGDEFDLDFGDDEEPDGDEDMDDEDMEEGDGEDEEAGVLSAVGDAVTGHPLDAAQALIASTDSKRVMALARKIASRGDRELARRVARLAKKN